MDDQQRKIVIECSELSAAGKIHFGQVVARLVEADIERYHADYSRMETTFYSRQGGTCVVSILHDTLPVAEQFSAAGVESAVRQAQRGQIMYPEFTRQALQSGCVGYFVQIAGKCVQYFGRKGEIHVERFPD